MKGWGGLVLPMDRQHRGVYRIKQPVGTRERGGTDRRTAVGWDEGFGAGEDKQESECRRGRQRRVSQPGQHGTMIGSAGGALASPKGPR